MTWAAAEANLRYRCEPAQVKAHLRRNEEGSFRGDSLPGDGLKQSVIQPAFKWTYSSRVSLKHPSRKGINLIVPDLHLSESV